MPALRTIETKSKPATVSLQVRVSIAIFCISFCQGKQPVCNDIHVLWTKLQVSTGPGIAFELRRVTLTESEHKTLLISCHMTRLMAALQDKTLSDDSLSSSFRKSAILGPAPIDGLSWTTAKSVRSSLWSLKVDAEIWTLFISGNGRRSIAFLINCIKTYVNCVCVQLFINCASNIIPLPYDKFSSNSNSFRFPTKYLFHSAILPKFNIQSHYYLY